jgi:hypothetical protein
LSFCPLSFGKRKGQKDKQHNVQKKGTKEQATQCSKEQGQKDKQHNGPFSFGHYVTCPSVLFFLSLCCLSFCPFSVGHGVACPSVILKDKQHNGQKEKGQKNKQHNGQKKKNRRTSNTMDKRKGTESKATQ